MLLSPQINHFSRHKHMDDAFGRRFPSLVDPCFPVGLVLSMPKKHQRRIADVREADDKLALQPSEKVGWVSLALHPPYWLAGSW